MRAWLLLALVVAAGWDGPVDDKQKAEAVRLARETLARTTSIAADRFQIVSAVKVQWKDSSLGCPDKGMVYTPRLESGFKIVLVDADHQHEVHVAGGRAVICGDSKPSPKASPQATVRAGLQAAASARRHMADQLHVSPDDITVSLIRPSVTPERGCTEATGAAGQQVFYVELAYQKVVRRYRATDTGAWPCESA